jgi:hypothetical protein
MRKELTAVGAAILAIGFATPASASLLYPDFYFGRVYEAEKGFNHKDGGVAFPHDKSDNKAISSGGKFVRFGLGNYVEHKTDTRTSLPFGGWVIAHIFFSSPVIGTSFAFEVEKSFSFFTGPLLPSTAPLAHPLPPFGLPNPWWKYGEVQLPVWLPPGKIQFHVRNLTLPSFYNGGNTVVDYDRIIFTPYVPAAQRAPFPGDNPPKEPPAPAPEPAK